MKVSFPYISLALFNACDALPTSENNQYSSRTGAFIKPNNMFNPLNNANSYLCGVTKLHGSTSNLFFEPESEENNANNNFNKTICLIGDGSLMSNIRTREEYHAAVLTIPTSLGIMQTTMKDIGLYLNYIDLAISASEIRNNIKLILRDCMSDIETKNKLPTPKPFEEAAIKSLEKAEASVSAFKEKKPGLQINDRVMDLLKVNLASIFMIGSSFKSNLDVNTKFGLSDSQTNAGLGETEQEVRFNIFLIFAQFENEEIDDDTAKALSLTRDILKSELPH